MTLLELLKEHLKEWPEGVIAMAQDSDGELRQLIEGVPDEQECKTYKHFFCWAGRGWAGTGSWIRQVSCDARTAIVTREMWEAV